MNVVIISGHVGKEPTGGTKDDFTYCNFSLATDESYKGKDGARVEKTEWHNVKAMNRTAESVLKHVKKGDRISVQGKLSTRKYTDKEGIEKYVTEIIASSWAFEGSRPKAVGGEGEAMPAPVYATDTNSAPQPDDDLPF